MRIILWTFTILFALAGLAVRGDYGFGGGYDAPTLLNHYADLVARGFFLLAFLSCPFLWRRSAGFLPDALVIPGKQRFMMALALIVAVPLILPWPF